MNPYASYLADRDALKVLSETPAQLQQFFNKLGERLQQPWAPGKWTGRQILCHLADCELAFGFRYRQAVAEDRYVAQSFDQDKWARTYAAYDAAMAIETFSALRRWNLTFFGNLKPGVFDRRITHPERGELTIRDLVETSAGHDLNHLRQFEALAQIR